MIRLYDSVVRQCLQNPWGLGRSPKGRRGAPATSRFGHTIWLFLGNDRGGRTAAILLSIMASCKANHVEPWAYTRAMISAMTEQPRDANPPQTLLPSLLPDAWLASHPEAHRPWSR